MNPLKIDCVEELLIFFNGIFLVLLDLHFKWFVLEGSLDQICLDINIKYETKFDILYNRSFKIFFTKLYLNTNYTIPRLAYG